MMTHTPSLLSTRHRPIRAAIATVAAVGALTLTGCSDRESRIDEELASSDQNLSPTRGNTGSPTDPETQGTGGMFTADTGATSSSQTNEYTSGIVNQKQEEIPTEKWDGTAFGQEHESRYTTQAEERPDASDGSLVADASSDHLEERIRTQLEGSADRLALSEEQLAEIDVAVDDGRVRLQGEVPDAASRDRIERHVAQLDGVRSVDNQLSIRDTEHIAE